MDSFFRTKTKEEENIVLEENKKELELTINNFKQPGYKKDLEATAQLILNLLFLVPGTYPDLPEMGINIKQYQFEFLTQEILTKLETHVFNQIQTYMPSTQIIQVIARTHRDPKTNAINLGLGFAIATSVTETQQFFIFFSDTNENKIKSKIIY